MSTMTNRLFRFVFLVYALACARGQEDEWIDPYNMTHYDASSKTMRKSSGVPKKADTEGIPSRDSDLDENDSSEISKCFQKMVILQRAIEDIKHKALLLKQHPGFIKAQNSKLNQLLKSIEQLRMPHQDDFCHVPWLCTYIEEARRSISVGLLIFATYFTSLDVLSEPCLLITVGCAVTILFLSVCLVVKWRQGQLGLREEREQNLENDQQNDDGEQEQEEEGEGENLDPEDQGQEEIVPPVENLGPEQAEERGASEPRGQGPDASQDECCDENYSITKMPITETQPDLQHCAE